MRSNRTRIALPLALLGLLAPAAARGQVQAPAASGPAPASVTWTVSNTTRVESWRFFEPPPTGGDPDYSFIGNRLRAGATATWSRFDVGLSAQYVQFGQLPTNAIGPGALGTGALYYSHSTSRNTGSVYIPAMFVRVRFPGRISVQVGRFPYQSGAESPSGRPKIEAVKRSRIDARLIGDFEWSLYQRAFDGMRADLDRDRWHLSGSWFTPTQGGFEERAGGRMSGIVLSTISFTLRPSVAIPATDLRVFAAGYQDDRPVTARPDNTGLAATRVDIGIATFGASAVGSATVRRGEVDWLLWFAGQKGSWYEDDHAAWSVAIEAGHQWRSGWQPWVRGGILHASGDADSSDGSHGTFFPMLPTARKYALTTVYAPMNLNDLFVDLSARPLARLTTRIDVRRLRLAEAADLWYSGSGATQQSGSLFGYAGRRSGNATGLATVVEGAADLALGRRWSVNGFVGLLHGGPVVAASFPGRWLKYFYLEHVVRL